MTHSPSRPGATREARPNASALCYLAWSTREVERLERFVRDALTSPKNVVIVGAGLIGLEVASTLASIGCRVALIEFQKRVMVRPRSPHMAGEIERLHRTAGVEMHLEAGIAEIHERAAHQ